MIHASRDQERIEALKRLVKEDPEGRHFFVDFDHTLLLTNSTDLLINSARPRFIFWPLMKGLGLLRPWIVMRQGSTLLWRDPIRIRVIRYFQGKRLVNSFRANAKRLWRQYRNPELFEILETLPVENLTIVSFGVDEVIHTLLQGTSLENVRIIAPTSVTMTKERRKGKLGMLRERGIVLNKFRDVVITDSATDDADLLERVEQAFHIEWYGA